jgi:single-stranded DNA-binding protein
VNQVALVGNMTDDPELRYTQSGAALAGFTVAVSDRSKHNGEWGRTSTMDVFRRARSSGVEPQRSTHGQAARAVRA